MYPPFNAKTLDLQQLRHQNAPVNEDIRTKIKTILSIYYQYLFCVLYMYVCTIHLRKK